MGGTTVQTVATLIKSYDNGATVRNDSKGRRTAGVPEVPKSAHRLQDSKKFGTIHRLGGTYQGAETPRKQAAIAINKCKSPAASPKNTTLRI